MNGPSKFDTRRLQNAPRCTARSKRSGRSCGAPAVLGYRVCRFHGARSGPPKGNKNALKLGFFTEHAVAARRAYALQIGMSKGLVRSMEAALRKGPMGQFAFADFVTEFDPVLKALVEDFGAVPDPSMAGITLTIGPDGDIIVTSPHPIPDPCSCETAEPSKGVARPPCAVHPNSTGHLDNSGDQHSTDADPSERDLGRKSETRAQSDEVANARAAAAATASAPQESGSQDNLWRALRDQLRRKPPKS